MTQMKYKGGVSVRTPFGIVSNGDTIEVPESVAENLSSAVWEKADEVQPKTKTKSSKEGEK